MYNIVDAKRIGFVKKGVDKMKLYIEYMDGVSDTIDNVDKIGIIYIDNKVCLCAYNDRHIIFADYITTLKYAYLYDAGKTFFIYEK